MKDVKDLNKRYTMFMGGKTQYYKDIINVFKIRHFFFGNLQAHPNMYMQVETTRIAKTRSCRPSSTRYKFTELSYVKRYSINTRTKQREPKNRPIHVWKCDRPAKTKAAWRIT